MKSMPWANTSSTPAERATSGSMWIGSWSLKAAANRTRLVRQIGVARDLGGLDVHVYRVGVAGGLGEQPQTVAPDLDGHRREPAADRGGGMLILGPPSRTG